VLTLLTRSFSLSMPLLKVGMLVCVQWMLPLPIRSFAGYGFRVFEPRLFLAGWAISVGRYFEVVLQRSVMRGVTSPYYLQGEPGSYHRAF
jgi:hypothetical protein